MSEQQQREVGNYVLESKLGQGGMGEVFLGRHKSLGTQAVIKILGVTFSENEEFRERFSREARTQAQLRHPNITQVLDHVEQDGCWHLIMEYMERGTVKDAMAQAGGRLDVDQAVAWARQALEGLAFAHEHKTKIVHRDVKPANLLINDRGEAAVTDFGLAITFGDARLTKSGMAIGTPAYMSPEQIAGESEIDHRTDIYSLGVVLYEMLTGRVPFELKSSFEMFRVLTQEPPRPRQLRPELAPELEAILLKALAKAPTDRYQTCREMIGELDAYEQGGEVKAMFFMPSSPPPVPSVAHDENAPTVVAPSGATPASAGTPPPPPSAASLPPPPVSGPVAAAAPASEPVPVQRQRSNTMPVVLAVAAVLLMAAGAVALVGAWWFFGRDRPAEGVEQVADVTASNDETVAVGGSTIPEEGGSTSPGSGGEPVGSEPAGMESSGDMGGDGPSASGSVSDGAASSGGPLEKIGQAGRKVGGASGSDPMAGAPPDEPTRTIKVLSAEDGEDTEPKGIEYVERKTERSAVQDRRRARPMPERPRVAVLALGEPTLAGHLESELERRLSAQGIDVGDERGSMELNDLLRRWGDQVGTADDIAPILEEEGFDVLVLAQVQVTGERELRHIGGRDYATQARVRLNAFLIPARRSLGGGWTEALEYTDLNAPDKAEQTTLGDDPDIVALIRERWAEIRRRGL